MLKSFISALFVLLSVWSYGQQFHLTGTVKDSSSGTPLPFVEIVLYPEKAFVLSDEHGRYSFQGLAPGQKNLQAFHVRCEKFSSSFILQKDTQINIQLHLHDHQFETHVVYGHQKEEEDFTDHDKSISGKALKEIQYKSFGEILSQINGVYSLKTGQAISKPVIRGLQGNRVTIVENGLRLESQQWGDEHAPEIDSRSAESFKVLKGAGTLRYGYDAIGGIVIIEPGKIADSLLFTTGFSMVSNGIGGSAFAKISNQYRRFKWQLRTNLKKSGDQHAPDYMLSNTAFEEFNGGFRTVYEKGKIKNETTINAFYTRLGILKASHIGNLTDLNRAIGANEPFIIQPFGYNIGKPSQQVAHFSFNERYNYKGTRYEHVLQYGFQYNKRKEFDNRRGAKEGEPQLDFNLITQSLEWVVERHFGMHRIQFGSQTNYQINTQKGYLLIPNFRKITSGVFAIHRFEHDKWLFETGMRLDKQSLHAFFYADTGTVHKNKQFHDIAFNTSLQYQWNHDWMLFFQAARLWRAPSVNELYSNGLHHGAAALEYGDPNLKKEVSYTLSTTLVYNHNKFGFELEPYIRYINGFMSLQPHFPPVLTIRGAFPVYYFQSNNVWFKGVDAQWNWAPWLNWVARGQYSIMQVKTQQGKYLNGMPPVNMDHSVKYNMKVGKAKNTLDFGFGWKYVFKQIWASPQTDYLAPPAGYSLFRLSSSIQLQKKKLHNLSISADNLLNKNYRDYLNRLRFYSNDQGFNFIINYTINF